MAISDSVVELYIPLDCLSSSSGIIIGWNISKFKGCISNILPLSITSKIKLSTILQILTKLYNKQDRLNKYCTLPIILGWYQTNDNNYPTVEIEEYKQLCNFWINIDDTIINTTNSIASIYNNKKITLINNNEIKLPTLKDIYCCNSRYKSNKCHIIFYNRPTTSNYISVTPYSYDITNENNENNNEVKITDLDYIIRQINISSFIGTLISNILNEETKIDEISSSSNSRSNSPTTENNDGQITDMDKDNSSLKRNKHILLVLLLFPIRIFFLLFYFYSNMFHYVASKNLPFTQFNLADHSLFCMIVFDYFLNYLVRQFLRKLNEMETWPHLYVKSLQKYNYDESSSEAYMQLWSSVSRTAIDVISGVICCSLLYYFSAGVLSELHNVC